MNRAATHQLPRIMWLASVAREVLGIDVHEVYKLARAGRLQGACGDSKYAARPWRYLPKAY